MPPKLLLDHCAKPDGTINAEIMACALGIDAAELARAAPGPERLRDVYSVICIIRPWTRTAADSWSWYKGRRLERFGGQTCAALVRAGRSEELKAFLQTGEALCAAWPPPLGEAGHARLAASG